MNVSRETYKRGETSPLILFKGVLKWIRKM